MGVSASGSSPLSRGIPGTREGVTSVDGIIPALAGNTLFRQTKNRIIRDHPRSRGEYECEAVEDWDYLGSSPLSRGIQQHLIDVHGASRIIPALAGNTGRGSSPSPLGRDHPRSRGEYPLANRRGAAAQGSSPLSRGIPTWDWDELHGERIIPALAGNTYRGHVGHVGNGDHPRSRGEYWPPRPDPNVPQGSSPLSRGIPDCSGSHGQPPGIIPALAGNTGTWDYPPAHCWDHPRSRGEYGVRHTDSTMENGSSPLSRGIHKPANLLVW